jgi:MOSC domain-containing protein YiiM
MKKVISVNLGKSRDIIWRKKTVQTGIFKYPVNHPIHLGKKDVVDDDVIDRKYHGGTDKAVYLYSADHYPFWKEKFPELTWDYGMFGENITVEGLQEKEIQIGDIYTIGSCRIQVSQPRQPCFKLGVRFETQKIVKEFIQAPFPGFYARVIETGEVQKNDSMQLSERLHNTIGLIEVWDLLYGNEPDVEVLEFALEHQHLAEDCKANLRKVLKKLNQ